MNEVPLTLRADNRIFVIHKILHEGGFISYPMFAMLPKNERVLAVTVKVKDSQTSVYITIDRGPT